MPLKWSFHSFSAVGHAPHNTLVRLIIFYLHCHWYHRSTSLHSLSIKHHGREIHLAVIKQKTSQCQHVAPGALTSETCFHLSIRYPKTSHQRPWPPNWSMPRRPQKHSQPFLPWNRNWIVNTNLSNSKILIHEILDAFPDFYQHKLIQYAFYPQMYLYDNLLIQIRQHLLNRIQNQVVFWGSNHRKQATLHCLPCGPPANLGGHNHIMT